MSQENSSALKVVVESKDRPVRVLEYSVSEVIGPRYMRQTTRRSVVTARVLDDAQEMVVRDAHVLADALGVETKIEDLGEQSLPRRLFRRLTFRKPKAPFIELPKVWNGLDSGVVLFHLFAGNEPHDHENVLDLVHTRLRGKHETETQRGEEKSVEEEDLFLGA
jgi:hypothetical protein